MIKRMTKIFFTQISYLFCDEIIYTTRLLYFHKKVDFLSQYFATTL